MQDKYYDMQDCIFPDEAEIGDIHYCPGCARKWQYQLLILDEEQEYEAWFSNEIG